VLSDRVSGRDFAIIPIMKLFLSSVSVTNDQLPYFVRLVGKDPADIKFALIENGADVYDEADRGFVKRESDALEVIGLKLNRIDLRDYFDKPEIQGALMNFDVIWVGGGNTYYLRWALRKAGFDACVQELLSAGIVYGGGSAGAVVAGPTLKNFENADEPEKAPELVEDGLNLTPFVPLPHWENGKFGDVIAEVKDAFDKSDFKVIPITDEQAIIVDDDTVTVVP
jgi:dipeptidase E